MFFGLALLLLCNCAEPDGWLAGKPALAAEQDEDRLGAPTWVLDGTDLLELGDLRRTDLPSQPGGRYGAEQGGSELSLSITGGADGRWTVERRYKEPGADAQVVTYTAERRGAALISTDGSLTIQGTEEGVLVLELNSGNDSLPPDYWVHYLKAE